jgi:hypothetical protein
MMEWWGDAAGPNEVVDVETLLVTHYLLAGNSLFNKEHLRKCEIRRTQTKQRVRPGRYQRP